MGTVPCKSILTPWTFTYICHITTTNFKKGLSSSKSIYIFTYTQYTLYIFNTIILKTDKEKVAQTDDI